MDKIGKYHIKLEINNPPTPGAIIGEISLPTTVPIPISSNLGLE
jgi:hypothetical protein